MTGFGRSFLNAFWPNRDLGQRAIVAVAVLMAPIATIVISALSQPVLSSGVGMLSPLAIIAAGQLTSFVFLANLRVKLAENARSRPASENPDRKMVDTAVVGLLTGTLVSILSALIISILVVTASDSNGQISGIWAGAVLTLTTVSFGVFASCVPNLWFAYRQTVEAETERPARSNQHALVGHGLFDSRTEAIAEILNQRRQGFGTNSKRRSSSRQ